MMLTGELAVSTAGHDKGTYYLILREAEGSVFLTDGRLRPLSRPKRKNRRHIRRIREGYDTALTERIRAGDTTVRDEEIRKLIREYKRSHTNV